MSEIVEWNSATPYDEFLESARENVEIMKARFNDIMLNESEQEILSSIQNTINVLVIGTDRCNDTAGTLPVLARMASHSPNMELRVIDSDNNAKFHQNFRVMGKRKTPVVLFLNTELHELCRWVERPNVAYQVVNEKNLSLEELKTELKRLYSDPEIMRQSLGELMNLLLRADLLLGRKKH